MRGSTRRANFSMSIVLIQWWVRIDLARYSSTCSQETKWSRLVMKLYSYSQYVYMHSRATIRAHTAASCKKPTPLPVAVHILRARACVRACVCFLAILW
jgi:hypothetical protein